MVGREITNLYPMPIAKPLDEPIMETKNWNVVEPNTGRHLVKDANIVLKKEK
nr:hypothetical protein [Thermoanaerobacter sp. RKWS2]